MKEGGEAEMSRRQPGSPKTNLLTGDAELPKPLSTRTWEFSCGPASR